MKKILVTTDSSRLGHSAVAHAQSLAGALGAKLVVLTVQPDPTVAMAGEFAYAPVSVSVADMAAEDEAIRAELRQLAGDADIRVEHATGRTVAQTILAAAQAEGASLIVMATHGRSGLGRVLLGSVAEAVVHGATLPVMLVKGEQPVTAWR